MTCADYEILICDYVDGTLAPAQRAELERHLAECPSCAELTRDAAAAVAFMERAAEVEPPPELITRILFDAPWSKGKPRSHARSWMSALLAPILTPRYAMGMAMTILSFSMLARFVTPVRQLQWSDLRPAAVWVGLEERATRLWGRTVKYYDSLRFVYQIQSTLREWQQQDEETRPAAKNDERKLPVRTAPPQGATSTGDSGNHPAPNAAGGGRDASPPAKSGGGPEANPPAKSGGEGVSRPPQGAR